MSDHKDWEKLDGKRIRTAWFATVRDGMQPYVEQSNGKTLSLSAIYMGDRTELWIVEEEAGKELARYNARSMESIHWL
jgi:hypothetical protein